MESLFYPEHHLIISKPSSLLITVHLFIPVRGRLFTLSGDFTGQILKVEGAGQLSNYENDLKQ